MQTRDRQGRLFTVITILSLKFLHIINDLTLCNLILYFTSHFMVILSFSHWIMR